MAPTEGKIMIVQILKFFLPSPVRKKIARRLGYWQHSYFLKNLRKKIIAFYSTKSSITLEETEILNFLQLNPIQIFPYDFTKKYRFKEVDIYYDKSKDLKYINFNGKRLYFKRGMKDNAIKNLYRGLLIDQDVDSPHRYLDESFKMNKSDIVVDAGAAEGNFSLMIVDSVKKIFLFESDPEWIEPLNATFEPWKQKVEIIQKRVSNETNEANITLDDFYELRKFTFIKADIEGDELKLLEGLKKTLESETCLKLAICTYHKQEDFMKFSNVLKKKHFHLSSPKGYMIFYHYKNIEPPFLRKGILRAEKK